MAFRNLRRVNSPSYSPVEIYLKGIIKSILTLALFLIAGVVYFLYADQGVYYYSLGVLVAIITSVFLGGYASGRTEKGWFFGLLIGLTYGFILVLLEDFLAAENIGGYNSSKVLIILAIIGALGGTFGYQFRLSKIRYNIRRRGLIN